MKFELKTDNENNTKSFLHVFKVTSVLALFIILCDVALKFGVVSRSFQIDYNCRLLSVKKSKSNFKNLSTLTNLTSKQEMWEFCKELVK